MRNISFHLIALLFVICTISLLFLTSCKEDDLLAPTEIEFALLKTLMAQNDLELSDLLNVWVISGLGLTVDPTEFTVSGYYVIDIRGTGDFNCYTMTELGPTQGGTNLLDASISYNRFTQIMYFFK